MTAPSGTLNNWFESFNSDTALGGPPLTLNGAATVETGDLDFATGQIIAVNPGSNTTATISSLIGLTETDIYHVNVAAGLYQSGNPECVLSAPIGFSLYSTSLQKDGAGTLRLTGTNTYKGTNIVAAGTLQVDGVQPLWGVQLSGGTLKAYRYCRRHQLDWQFGHRCSRPQSGNTDVQQFQRGRLWERHPADRT